MKIISRKEAKEQGFKKYFTGKPCARGHIAKRSLNNGSCVECRVDYYQENKGRIAERDKSYRQENKEKVAERMKAYYQENKEKLAERGKAYRKGNKEKIAEAMKTYYEGNKEKLSELRKVYYQENKEKFKVYQQENPIPIFIRGSLSRILTDWKGGRIEQEAIHGYTFEELEHHIESQFADGMSWDNRSEWHIDHIKPIKAFLDEGITDPAIINALDNLQPLWAKDNLNKGAKYDS